MTLDPIEVYYSINDASPDWDFKPSDGATSDYIFMILYKHGRMVVKTSFSKLIANNTNIVFYYISELQ